MAKLIPGTNDFETWCHQNNREDLLKEWDYNENDCLPSEITVSSGKKIHWHMIYFDTNTKKEFDFKWQTTTSKRIEGRGCPYLSGQAIKQGFNDLATTNPELTKEWHPIKNGNLKPTDVTANCHKKVWWMIIYHDPKTSRDFNFEWQATVANRTSGNTGCPYLTGKAVLQGFNDLATTHPELAEQWHPTKNGKLKPTDIMLFSGKKVWWYLPYDDPDTGKHFDFEWQAVVSSRLINGCPFLSGKAVWLGFNDLATTHPELAKQWHPTKNDNLKPTDVTAGSHKKAWWLLPYDDPKTSKHFNFEWCASIDSRTLQNNCCPYLSGHAVWTGFNDLATTNLELSKEWHPTKNGKLTPQNVSAGSHEKVWWYLPYDDPNTDKRFNFVWRAEIKSRVAGNGCPYLSNTAIWSGFNDLATTHPELAEQWHPTKNGNLKPTDVVAGNEKKVWWLLPYDDPKTGKHFDFEWQARIADRIKGRGCPYLVGKAVWAGYNDLLTLYPSITQEWHPTKNRDLRPTCVTAYSKKKAWWICPICKREYKSTIGNRTQGGTCCPYCVGSVHEKLIDKILTEKKIPFRREVRFKGCGISKYPIDFYLPKDKIIIEYDGIQHFNYVPYFHDTQEDFKKRVDVDNLKTQFCKDKGYYLLKIPYIYKKEKDIERLITKFIETKEAPQEIIDFYKKYDFSNYTKLYSNSKSL